MNFGKVTIDEQEGVTASGLRYTHLIFYGQFWGFEEGPDGKVCDYLVEIGYSDRKWLVIDLSGLSLYTDNGPVYIRGMKHEAQKRGGSLGICGIKHLHVKQVMDISGWEYFDSVDEILQEFESIEQTKL